MYNTRHISFAGKLYLEFQGNVTPSLNRIIFRNNIGCISLPPNKIYSISNINFSSSKLYASVQSFVGISTEELITPYLRYYSSDDPRAEYLKYFTDDSWVNVVIPDLQYNDITSSENVNYNYIQGEKYSVNIFSSNTTKLNLKQECIPVTTPDKFFKIDDFFFKSDSNPLLCFSFFPKCNFRENYFTKFDCDYTINFDLTQV